VSAFQWAWEAVTLASQLAKPLLKKKAAKYEKKSQEREEEDEEKERRGRETCAED